jgi:hypothetical protein
MKFSYMKSLCEISVRVNINNRLRFNSKKLERCKIWAMFIFAASPLLWAELMRSGLYRIFKFVRKFEVNYEYLLSYSLYKLYSSVTMHALESNWLKIINLILRKWIIIYIVRADADVTVETCTPNKKADII